MQLASTPRPAAAVFSVERMLPRLDPKLAAEIPRAVLAAPLGSGTVASELDRAIRVRFAGDGEPSARELVPETQAAVDLLASSGGPRLERALRSIASVADGHRGADDLTSLTLHADKGTYLAGEVFDDLDLDRQDGIDIARLDSPREARKFVRDATRGGASNLNFESGRNRYGHISIAPDVSRELLSTLGLYAPKAGDAVADAPRADREEILVDAWKTLVHETHHSVTPEPNYDDEAVNVIEEAVPTVMEELQAPVVIAKAGADIVGAAARIGRAGADDAVAGALDWSPWNRDALPAPPKASVATEQGRYVDGPRVLSQLLRLAGVDTAGADGIKRADTVLQGERATQVPARIAALVADRHRLDAGTRDQLVDMIRASMVGDASLDDIERLVAPGR